MQDCMFQSLGWEDPLEKEMETYSNILAWEILWTEEPGGLIAHGVTKALDIVTKNKQTKKKWTQPDIFSLLQRKHIMLMTSFKTCGHIKNHS